MVGEWEGGVNRSSSPSTKHRESVEWAPRSVDALGLGHSDFEVLESYPMGEVMVFLRAQTTPNSVLHLVLSI